MLQRCMLCCLVRCMLCCSVCRHSTQLGPMLRQPRSACQCCAQSVRPAWLRFDRICSHGTPTVPRQYRLQSWREEAALCPTCAPPRRKTRRDRDHRSGTRPVIAYVQHAACNVQHVDMSACNGAACNMQHAACNMSACNMQHMQHATCNKQHAGSNRTCNMQHATVQQTTCNNAACDNEACNNAACNKCSMDCTVPSVRSREGVGVGKPSPGADVALVCVSWSNVACCPLHVACCLLHVVRCMLHVARCTCRCKLRGGCNRCAWFVV